MRMIGQVATTSTNEVAVNATTVTEQTSGAQRSLKSSSASDAAAGTGARTVRVRYYTLVAADGTIAGPFFETVTLTGTVAAAMVATNVALVDRMEVMNAGSGGVAAGTISLYAASDGTGTVIASIATGDVETKLGLLYVPTGYRARIRDLAIQGGDAAAALFRLRSVPYPLGLEKNMAGDVPASSTTGREVLFADLAVVGPARLQLYVKPANTNAQTSYASAGAVLERVAAF